MASEGWGGWFKLIPSSKARVGLHPRALFCSALAQFGQSATMIGVLNSPAITPQDFLKSAKHMIPYHLLRNWKDHKQISTLTIWGNSMCGWNFNSFVCQKKLANRYPALPAFSISSRREFTYSSKVWNMKRLIFSNIWRKSTFFPECIYCHSSTTTEPVRSVQSAGKGMPSLY